MTPEQRAAAERVRRVLAGEDGVKVYGCADWLTFFRAEKGMCLRAYLAEHPADDDEPATYEWAREQSPHIGRTDGKPVLYLGALSGVGIEIKTRGQLRTLLKGLGR